MKVTEEERHAQRLANVSAWLDVIEDSARELEQEVLSRTSETASEAGADPDPRVVLCRHPASARMGRLCLLCDNTGFASAREVEGERVDPYLVDPPREVWAVRRDESDSARRARNAERLDAIIASLQRDARLRAGVEVREDELRYVRVISRIERGLGRTGQKILAVLESLPPGLRRSVLQRDEIALAVLASVVPGRIRAPL